MRRTLYLLILLLVPLKTFSQSDALLFGSSTKLTKGGTFLDFDLRSDIGYIDNYLFQNAGKQSTSFAEIKSDALLQIEQRQHLVRLKGAANYIAFGSFDEDNHADFNLNADYHYKFTANKETVLSGGYSRGFIYRGQDQSLGLGELLSKGDSKNATFANLTFNYGRIGSIAMMNISLGASNSEYQTRREQTHIFDVKKLSASAGFDYNLSGKTYASIEIDYNQSKFKYSESRDDKRASALVGVKWQSTVITKISALIGYQQIDFDQSTIAGKSNFKWKFNIDWRPLEYSHFKLSSGRTFEDALRGIEDYRLVDEHSISMGYTFSERLALIFGVGLKFEESISGNATIEQDYLSSSTGIKYKFKSSIELYAKYDFNQLKSTIQLVDYNRNAVAIGVRIVI